MTTFLRVTGLGQHKDQTISDSYGMSRGITSSANHTASAKAVDLQAALASDNALPVKAQEFDEDATYVRGKNWNWPDEGGIHVMREQVQS